MTEAAKDAGHFGRWGHLEEGKEAGDFRAHSLGNSHLLCPGTQVKGARSHLMDGWRAALRFKVYAVQLCVGAFVRNVGYE